MKNKSSLLSLASLTLLIFLFGCAKEKENLAVTGRTVNISAAFPETKVTLTRDEANALTYFKWNANDIIKLVFRSETDATVAESQYTVQANDISADGRVLNFQVTVPSGLAGDFTLYGVYGGTVSGTEITLNATVSNGSLSGDPKSNLVMYFSVRLNTDSLPEQTPVSFNSIGSLFNVNLTNSGTTALANVKEMRLISTDPNWPKNVVYGNGTKFNLIDGSYVETESSLTSLTFPSPSASLSAGSVLSLYGWYYPKAGQNFPALSVELGLTDGTVHATADTRTPSSVLASGKTYKFNMKWDGTGLLFDVNNPSKLGFSRVYERFTIKQKDMPDSSIYIGTTPESKGLGIVSMALTNDDRLLVKTLWKNASDQPTRSGIVYYDAYSGAYSAMRSVTGQNNTFHRWGSDDYGNLVAGRPVYKLSGKMTLWNVTLPEDVTIDYPASHISYNILNPADANACDGGQISITGNMDGSAVMFVPVKRDNQTPVALRYTITNGKKTALTPELISYGNYTSKYKTETGYNPLGQYALAFPLGDKVEDGYIMGDRNEISYYPGDGSARKRFQYSDLGEYQWGGYAAGKAFDMNGKKYVAILHIPHIPGTPPNHGAILKIFDITNPDAIEMTQEQRDAAGIKFLAYQSPTFVYDGNSYNRWMYGDPIGNIDIKYLDNGNLILYVMYEYVGVRAYDIVK